MNSGRRLRSVSEWRQGTDAFAPDAADHDLGGCDEDRLADINDALRDPGIRAIPATTGGKGAYRMIGTTDTIALDQIEHILIRPVSAITP